MSFGFCLWGNESGGTYSLITVFSTEAFWFCGYSKIRLPSRTTELWLWIRSDFFWCSSFFSLVSFFSSDSVLVSWFYSRTLSLCRVISWTCSLGFVSVLLGNDPCGLLASRFHFWPIWTCRLWIPAAWFFRFVSIKVMNVCVVAVRCCIVSSKLGFFSWWGGRECYGWMLFGLGAMLLLPPHPRFGWFLHAGVYVFEYGLLFLW